MRAWLPWHLLEEGFLQCWWGREGTEAAGQQQPAPQALLTPRLVHQLGENLVPQGWPALAPLHHVVRQHLLLPAAEFGLTREPQDLRTTKEKIIITKTNLMDYNLVTPTYQFVNLHGSSGFFRLQRGEGPLEGETLRLAPCVLQEDTPCGDSHTIRPLTPAKAWV